MRGGLFRRKPIKAHEGINDPKVLQEMKKNISEMSLTDNKKLFSKHSFL